MALQAKAIKQKMRSVGNIGKITKTMEMISASKMKKAIAIAHASKPYARAVFSLLSYLSHEKELKTHPLFSEKKPAPQLVVAIAGDKGLCGGYNLNVYKVLLAFKKKYHNGQKINCIVIGQHAERAAKKLGFDIIMSFTKVGKEAEETMRQVTYAVIEKFLKNECQNVYIAYTNFVSASILKPSIKKILPISTTMAHDILEEMEHNGFSEENLDAYTFEPNKDIMLNTVLPRLIEAVQYHSYLESAASEESARMFAMKSASDSAKKIFEELTMTYNLARQDAITKELSEIVGGAGALQHE